MEKVKTELERDAAQFAQAQGFFDNALKYSRILQYMFRAVEKVGCPGLFECFYAYP